MRTLEDATRELASTLKQHRMNTQRTEITTDLVAQLKEEVRILLGLEGLE